MKLKGSGLVEYGVPLALVGITVGIGLYYLTSNGNLLNIFLGSSNSKYSTSTKTATLNKKDNVTATVFSKNPTVPDPVIHFSGTVKPPEPTSNCVSGSCTIDFGSFVLTNIPENFNDTLVKAGNSGGLNELSDIIMQIAQQLEDQGDLAGAKDYRDLANLGHFMASGSAQMENLASISIVDNHNYLNDGTLISKGLTTPSTLSHIITQTSIPIGSALSYHLGEVRHKKNSGDSGWLDTVSRVPAAGFLEIYDKIQADPKYSSQMKSITTALYLKVDDLLENQAISYSLNTIDDSTSPSMELTYYDPLTGLPKTPITVSIAAGNLIASGGTSVTSAKISSNQNLNSVLICATGNNVDIQNTCN